MPQPEQDIAIPRLIELASQPWLLDADTAESWRKLLSAKLDDGKVQVTDFVKPVSKRADERAWEQDGALAVIPVRGKLIKRNSFFNSGSSYQKLRTMVAEALEDSSIEAILLDIDTPGGTADGLTGLDEFLTEAAGQKPLFAFADGQATSAAFWIASIAQEIAASPEAALGSIGVRTLHVDYSAAQEKRGIKVTHLAVGDFKTAGNSDEPLNEDARNYIMGQLEGIYRLFVEAVAVHRGLDAQVVRDTQARVYLAAEAKEIGLIDQVMSRDKFISKIKGSLSMNLSELKGKHPELVDQIQAAALEGMVSQTELEKALAQAKTETGQAERTRCTGLISAVLGKETGEKLGVLLESGATAEQAEAFAGLLGGSAKDTTGGGEAEKPLMASMLDAIQKAGEEGVKPKPEGEGKQTQAGDLDFAALVKDHQAEHKSSLAQAQSAVRKAHPKAHQAYIEKFNQTHAVEED